jgi:Bacterial regulatory protein, Fis family
MTAATIADKYIARDGGLPTQSSSVIVWAPVKISEKESAWLTKAILRGGYLPTRDRDGDSAPFLSDLRLMMERGLIKGMPWRITKFGRDCLRELEAPKVAARTPESRPLAASEIQKPLVPLSPLRRLADVERELILSALAQCNGNKTRAAAELGISVRTIRNKVKAYSATPPSAE